MAFCGFNPLTLDVTSSWDGSGRSTQGRIRKGCVKIVVGETYCIQRHVNCQPVDVGCTEVQRSYFCHPVDQEPREKRELARNKTRRRSTSPPRSCRGGVRRPSISRRSSFGQAAAASKKWPGEGNNIMMMNRTAAASPIKSADKQKGVEAQ